MLKRVGIIFLVIAMLSCWIVPVSAASTFKLKYSYANTSEITAHMDLLKDIFPAGKYWNGGKSFRQMQASAKSGDFSFSAMGVTDRGCQYRYRDGCSCHGYVCTSNGNVDENGNGKIDQNEKDIGRQCWGFANFVGYLLFPNYGIPTNCTKGWTKITGSNAKSVTLEPGDIVRMGGHSGIVWKVDGDTVYLAQVFGNHQTGFDKYGNPQKNHGKYEGCYIYWGKWNNNNDYLTNKKLVNAVASDSDNNFILKHPVGAVTGTTSTTPTTPTTPTTSTTPKITASGEKYPVTLDLGSGFGLRGVYTTNVGKITSVSASLTNLYGSTKYYSFSASPNTSSFNVNGTKDSSGKTLNSTIKFGSLSAGFYILQISITAKNGSKSTTHTVSQTIQIVGTKPTITASNEKYPSNNGQPDVTQGSGFGIRGKYTTNVGKITSVSATLKTSSGTTKYTFSASPNATSFDVNGTKGTNGKTLNSTIAFGSLGRGTYTLTINITAKNGTEVTTKTITKKITIK